MSSHMARYQKYADKGIPETLALVAKDIPYPPPSMAALKHANELACVYYARKIDHQCHCFLTPSVLQTCRFGVCHRPILVAMAVLLRAMRAQDGRYLDRKTVFSAVYEAKRANARKPTKAPKFACFGRCDFEIKCFLELEKCSPCMHVDQQLVDCGWTCVFEDDPLEELTMMMRTRAAELSLASSTVHAALEVLVGVWNASLPDIRPSKVDTLIGACIWSVLTRTNNGCDMRGHPLSLTTLSTACGISERTILQLSKQLAPLATSASHCASD